MRFRIFGQCNVWRTVGELFDASENMSWRARHEFRRRQSGCRKKTVARTALITNKLRQRIVDRCTVPGSFPCLAIPLRERRNARRAGPRTHSTTRNNVLPSPRMTATPRIFGFDAPSRGAVLPALGHENSPSSVQGRLRS